MADEPRSASVVGVRGLLLAIGLALGAMWFVVGPEASAPSGTMLALFAAAAVVGELVLLEQPRSRPVPLATAVIGGLALLDASAAVVALVAGGAYAIAAIVRLGYGEKGTILEFAQRFAGGAGAAGAAALGAAAAPNAIFSGATTEVSLNYVSVALVVGLILVATPAWETAELVARLRVPAMPVLLGRLRTSFRGLLVLGSVAVLTKLVYPVFGGWSLLLMALPLAAARVGLSQFAEIGVMYDQTVRAMSRVPETTGSATRGHGMRVGELAVLVSRDLGLSETQVSDVEAASYLHEVGQLTAADEERHDDVFIAHAGADLVREAGTMPRVATIIERHRDPYRLRHQGDSDEVPMPARVVRTVCDFDRWCEPAGPGRSMWDALERLHLGMAYDHDPIVIQSLTRVLTRRGDL